MFNIEKVLMLKIHACSYPSMHYVTILWMYAVNVTIFFVNLRHYEIACFYNR